MARHRPEWASGERPRTRSSRRAGLLALSVIVLIAAIVVAVVIGQSLSGTKRSSTAPTPSPTPTSSTVPCALTAAAGAGRTEAHGSIDTTSCWATHTGVQNGTGYTEAQILAGQSNLKHVFGDQRITKPGTVIDREWIDGCVAIDANNVTIKNSLIRTRDLCEGGDTQTDPSAINNGHYTVFGTLIEDTTVDGMDPGNGSGGGHSRGVFVGYGSECLQCNIFGFAMDAWTDGDAQHPSKFVDSYIHGLADDWSATGSSATPHENALYLNSSDYVTVEHDYVSSVRAGLSVTGAISLLDDWGAPNNDTVEYNYVEGGYGSDVRWGCGKPNDHFRGNALSSDNAYGGKFYVDTWTNGPGNAFTGNYIAETGAPFSNPPEDC